MLIRLGREPLVAAMKEPIQALLFDKDGTLFHFQRSWSHYTKTTIEHLAQGEPVLARRLADALGFDLATGAFEQASPVIAGTLNRTVAALVPHLSNWSAQQLTLYLRETASEALMVPVLPLAPLMQELRADGLRLGVATNDAEASARAHMQAEGVGDVFEFITGFDSGFGGKPGPGMCLAFADALGLHPQAIAMVGDSTHDLLAGRAAGMQTVAVLTGPAPRDVLAPLADVVLPDIGAIRPWMRGSSDIGR